MSDDSRRIEPPSAVLGNAALAGRDEMNIAEFPITLLAGPATQEPEPGRVHRPDLRPRHRPGDHADGWSSAPRRSTACRRRSTTT